MALPASQRQANAICLPSGLQAGPEQCGQSAGLMRRLPARRQVAREDLLLPTKHDLLAVGRPLCLITVADPLRLRAVQRQPPDADRSAAGGAEEDRLPVGAEDGINILLVGTGLGELAEAPTRRGGRSKSARGRIDRWKRQSTLRRRPLSLTSPVPQQARLMRETQRHSDHCSNVRVLHATSCDCLPVLALAAMRPMEPRLFLYPLATGVSRHDTCPSQKPPPTILPPDRAHVSRNGATKRVTEKARECDPETGVGERGDST